MDLARNKSQPQQRRPHAIRDVLPKQPATGQLVNFSGGHQVTPLGALDPQWHWTKKLRQSEMLFFWFPVLFFAKKLCPHDMFVLFIEFLLFVYFHFFWGGKCSQETVHGKNKQDISPICSKKPLNKRIKKIISTSFSDGFLTLFCAAHGLDKFRVDSNGEVTK